MIRELVLKDFPTWSTEKQISEYQAYKAMGDFSPFTESDYKIMEMVIENPNLEIDVECENGICSINLNDKPIEENERLDEAITNREWFESISVLFDVLFDETDDDSDNKNDDKIGSTPKLASYLKSILSKIKLPSDENKEDLLYSPEVETKEIKQEIYNILNGKTNRIKVDKDMLYLKKLLGISSSIAVEEILKYPIIKILIYGLKVSNVEKVIDNVYKNKEDYEKVIKIRKIKSLIDSIKKNVKSLKIRIKNPDEEQVRKSQLNKFKEILKQKEKTLSTLKPGTKEYSLLQSEIKIQQQQIKDFDSVYDELLLKSNKESNTKKNKLDDNVSKFQSDVKEIIKSIFEDSFDNFLKFKNEIKIENFEFNSKQIKLLNSILDGTHNAYKILKNKKEKDDLKEKMVKLYMTDGKGFGKGELFVSALIDGVSNQGGSKNFDILVDGRKKFELKAYDIKNESLDSGGIRLGKDGKIQGFNEFYELMDLISNIEDLFSTKQGNMGIFEIFNEMASTTNTKEIKELTNLLNDKPDDSNSKTILEILRSGEVTPKSFIKINKVIRLTASILQSISENNFHYAKLFGKTKNEIYAIKERKDKSSNNNDSTLKIELLVRKVDPKIEQKTIETIDKLLRLNFINDENYLINIINNIMKKINEKMKDCPMILLSTTKAEFYGKYTEFVFVKITQGTVRIAPIDLAPSSAKKLRYSLNM